MVIRISIKTRKVQQCRGIKMWAAHILDQFAALVPGMVKQPVQADSSHLYVMGDTQLRLRFENDSTGLIFQVVAESSTTSKSVSGFLAPPIPMLAYLLSLLHVMPGPGKHGNPVSFACQIDEASFSENETELAYNKLHEMVPKGFYVPYSRHLEEASAFFARNRGVL